MQLRIYGINTYSEEAKMLEQMALSSGQLRSKIK